MTRTPTDPEARPSLFIQIRRRLVPWIQTIRSHWFVRDVLFPFLLTRLTLLLIGGLAISLLPRDLAAGKWESSTHFWINMWSRWDAGWYLSIAREGYAYHPGQQSNINFAPLLPMLMRICSWIIGGTRVEGSLCCGIFVSNIALLTAMGYLVALTRLDFNQHIAARAALYTLTFPTSFFLSAIYPHSLFLALVLASFYYSRKQRWWLAGFLGGLATLARPNGAGLILALLIEYLYQRHYRVRDIRLDVLALGWIPVALAVWIGFLYHLSGDPALILKTQSAWGRSLAPPWEVLANFFSAPLVLHGHDHSITDLFFTFVLLVLIAECWGRVRTSYAVFATTMFILMISSGLIVSTMRYSLELFPIFIVLAIAGRSSLFERAYLVFGAGIGSIFMVLFALWRYVA